MNAFKYKLRNSEEQFCEDTLLVELIYLLIMLRVEGETYKMACNNCLTITSSRKKVMTTMFNYI